MPIPRSFPLRLLLLAVALCGLHCLGNGILPLIDRDEPRFSEATREMLQRDDWIVPYFNGEYRFDKPPLIYWMQAAAVKVFGEGEFAMRFPAAVCAALVAVVLVLWGRRWRDEATGWRAAIVFSFCVQIFLHARAAVADMPVVLAFTAAAWCAWLAGDGVRGARPAFWLALGLGFLAKGPLAWLPLLALPFAPASTRRALWRPWWNPLLGLLVMAGLVVAWGLPANLRTDWEFLKIGLGKHVLNRSVGTMEGHGGRGLPGYVAMLPFYFLVIWICLFPWSIWLPRTVKRWWREGRRDPVARYLGALVLVVFLVFTLVATKLPHYILPAYPMLALLIAEAWAPGPIANTAGAAPALEPGAGWNRKFLRVAAAWLMFALVMPFTAFVWLRHQAPAEDLWRKVDNGLSPATKLATVDYQEPSIVWSLRRRTTEFLDVIKEKKAAEWLAEPGPRLLICEAEKVPKLFPQLPPGVQAVPFGGFQIARFRQASLVALWKPAPK